MTFVELAQGLDASRAKVEEKQREVDNAALILNDHRTELQVLTQEMMDISNQMKTMLGMTTTPTNDMKALIMESKRKAGL